MLLYLDSSAIIFAHEGPPVLQQIVVQRVVETCLHPGGIVMSSILARMECRIRPLREQNQQLLARYDFLFGPFGLRVAEISTAIVERATQLRADHRLRTPDAIHLATALEARADVFLTGDKALAKCPGISVEVV